MDKKYYKRLFVLYDLDIPINKDIQKSYEFFSDIISNTGMEQITSRKGGKTIYYVDEIGRLLFRYNIENKHFLFDHKNFWLPSNISIHFLHPRNNIMKALLEHVFKIQVEKAGLLYK